MAEYTVAQAALAIVPSFSGIDEAIRTEAAKWGDTAGSAFQDAFNAKVGSLGPSDTDEAKKGESGGGSYADAFKARVEATLSTLPPVGITANTGELDAELEYVRAQLESLSNQTIGIDISDADAELKLSALNAELDAMGRKSETVKIRVDTGDSEAKLAALTAEADAAAGSEGGAGGLSGLASAAGGIGPTVPAIIALGAALVPVAGLAGGALAALPALLSGVGTGAAAIYVGIQGIIPAFQAMEKAQNSQGLSAAQVASNNRALANAMAQLTPAGRSFVAFAAGPLYSAFKGLETAVQAALLPGVQAGLTAMLPLFVAIQPFIIGAAEGIGEFVTQLGKMLGSPPVLGEINTIFKAGAGFMQQLGQAAITFFGAIISGGAQGAPILGVIGGYITDIANSFAHWVEGGGLQKFLAWLKENGPTIVNAVKNLVKGAGELIVALTPIGLALDNLLNALGLLIQVVSKGLTDAISYFENHWLGAWTDIHNIVNTAWHAIDNDALQPFINFFTVDLPGAIDAVVGFFTALPGNIVKGLGDVVTTITAPFKTAAAWINTNVIQPVIKFFTDLPGQVAMAIGDFFGTAWKDLTTVLTWLGTNLLTPVLFFFGKIPTAVATAIGDFFTTAWADLLTVLKWLGTNVLDPALFFFGALPGAVAKAIGDFFGTAWADLKAVLTWLGTNVLDPALFFFGHIPSSVAGVVVSFYDTAFKDLTKIGTWLDNNVWKPIESFFSGLAKRIGQAAGNVLGDITGGLTGVLSKIPVIGGLFHAEGGIFDGAQLAVIGEAGPEAVLPLNNPARTHQILSQIPPNVLANFDPSSFAPSLPNLSGIDVSGAIGRSGPAIHNDALIINHPSDVSALMQQAAFLQNARQL